MYAIYIYFVKCFNDPIRDAASESQLPLFLSL